MREEVLRTSSELLERLLSGAPRSERDAEALESLLAVGLLPGGSDEDRGRALDLAGAVLTALFGSEQQPALVAYVEGNVWNLIGRLHAAGDPAGGVHVAAAAGEGLPVDVVSGLRMLRQASHAAGAAGRWDGFRAGLAVMEARLDATDGDTPQAERTAARAELDLAWGTYHMELGLPELARQRLLDAERASRATGRVDPTILATTADLLTSSEAFTRFRERLEGWREADAWLFDPALQTTDPYAAQIALGLALSDALSEVELARQGEGDLERAVEPLRALLEHPLVLAGDRSTEVFARLGLAEAALLRGDMESAGSELSAAEALYSPDAGELPLEVEAWMARLRAKLHLAGLPPGEGAGGALEEQLSADLRHTRALARRQFDAWRGALRVDGSVGFLFHAGRRQLLSVLIELELRVGDGAPAGLAWLLRAQTLGAHARALGIEGAPELQELRSELLGDDHAALVILPGKDDGETHLFAFDGRDLVHQRAPSRDELRAPLESLSARLWAVAAGVPDSDDARSRQARILAAQARDFGNRLLPPGSPVRTVLARNGTLTVVGAELLGSVPPDVWILFEEPLGLTHALQSVQSLPAALATARRPELPFEYAHGLVIGLEIETASTDVGGPTSYRVTPEEVERWRAPFDEAADWVVGPEGVTRAVLAERSSAAASTAILELVLHGTRLEDRERPAALLLPVDADGRSDALGCDDFERLLATRGLVVLASCAAARGPERLGADLSADLPGAAIAAGARAVLAPRFDVELRSTEDLCRRLREHVAAGRPPTHALRDARRERAASGDAFVPFLDARFALQGVGHVSLPLGK